MSKSTSVRVYCRVRPFNKREKVLGDLEAAVEVDHNRVIVKERRKEFEFDHCFGPDTSQNAMFDVVGKAVVGDFMAGFNATQFVYGQSGSGKTWTMMGNTEEPGLIPRSILSVFDDIAQRESGWSFEIHASYLEIYLEKVNDLLDPKKVNLDIKQNKKDGVYVADLTKEPIAAVSDVRDVLRRGDKVRKVAVTKMNPGSSRSHSVLTVYLQSTSPDAVKTEAMLNLVDLAGSERIEKTGATGEVLKQGTIINLSLTTLSQVIATLCKLANYPGKKTSIVVPFRNSKLTRLLQSSLGGNSKTALCVHLSPHISNLDETISTLEFGKRARQIRTKAHAVVKKTHEQLLEELALLRDHYAKLKKLILERTSGKVPEELFGSLDNLDDDDDDDDDDLDIEINVSSELFGKQQEEERRAEEEARANRPKKKKRGVPRAMYEAVAQRVRDLIEEKRVMKLRAEELTAQVATLEFKITEAREKNEGVRRDVEVRDLEIATIRQRMHVLQMDHEEAKKHRRSREIAHAEAKELRKLMAQQQELLKREDMDSRELQQENTEIKQAVANTTRRLSVVELQVVLVGNVHSQFNRAARKKKADAHRRRLESKSWKVLLDQPVVPSGLSSFYTTQGDVNYAQLRADTALQAFGTKASLQPNDLSPPALHGYLLERKYSENAFARRFFCVCGSFLLGYEKEKSSTPLSCIALSGCKVGVSPAEGDKQFCFMVLSGKHFSVFAVDTDADKTAWMEAIKQAKFATHHELVALAWFNAHAVKAVPDGPARAELVQQVDNAPYGGIAAPEYALRVPTTGGIEGFLFEGDKRKSAVCVYCVVKDALLRTFELAKSPTEPASIVALEGCQVSDGKDSTALVLHLRDRKKHITFHAPTEALQARWKQAVAMAALVTMGHVIQASFLRERICIEAGIDPKGLAEDVAGNELAPACVQPFDERGKTLFQQMDGQWMSKELVLVTQATERFSAKYEPLDFYNRRLPRDAVPMFAAFPTEPIGVGIDGGHFAYPSARELGLNDPHFDAEGELLDANSLHAAHGVRADLARAGIAAAATLSRHRHRHFDAFGRRLVLAEDGSLLTPELEPLPVSTTVFDAFGQRVEFRRDADHGKPCSLSIAFFANDGAETVIATASIQYNHTNLRQLRHALEPHIPKIFPSASAPALALLVEGVAVSESELGARLASDCLPTLVVTCRDAVGRPLQFSGTRAHFAVDHEAADQVVRQAREADMYKRLGVKKRRLTRLRSAVSDL